LLFPTLLEAGAAPDGQSIRAYLDVLGCRTRREAGIEEEGLQGELDELLLRLPP
jgi:hypothetical protein